MRKIGKYKIPRRIPQISTTMTAGKGKYQAPTSGLEDVIFTWETVRDAAKYEEVKNKLAQHVGVQNWKSMTETSKTMSELNEPVITPPSLPVREYWTDNSHTIKTNQKNISTSSINRPIMIPKSLSFGNITYLSGIWLSGI